MPTETEVSSAPTSLLSALVDMPNPPPDDAHPLPDQVAAPSAGNAATAVEEPEIKPLVNDDAQDTKPDEGADPDAEKPQEHQFDDLESRMKQSPPVKKKTDAPAKEDKAATDTKPAETTPEQQAAEAAKTAKAQRDADLPNPAPQTHPKTAKLIRDFRAKTEAARDERDAATAKARTDIEGLQRQLTEFQEKAKAAPAVTIPKEVEAELASLRERVRELDITRDPQIEAKYDAPQKQNNEAIVGILKNHKYGFRLERADDPNSKLVEDPQAIAKLVKSGLTFDNLQQSIDTLRKAGLHGDARKIERLLDANETLSEQKQAEISQWKGNYDSRKQMTEAQAKQAQEKQVTAVRQATDQAIAASTEELTKAFPNFKAPAAPLPTDQPAVAKAKQEALDAYNAAEAKVQAEIKGFDTANVKPEEIPSLIGRVTAAAITSAQIKHQILPRVQKEMAARDARIKELETELAAIQKAGKISRLQVGGSEPSAAETKHADLESALKAAMPG